MQLTNIVSLDDNLAPLRLADLPIPEPGEKEVLIRVNACGVCHTELDEIEGRTPPPALPVIPGHQVVGRVETCGKRVTRLSPGQRVGVGWIFRSTGADNENLSVEFVATGRDVDGGYADYMVADERYANPIPDELSDTEAAPLLCAGAVGYRALIRAEIKNGEPLGLTGFGGSGACCPAGTARSPRGRCRPGLRRLSWIPPRPGNRSSLRFRRFAPAGGS